MREVGLFDDAVPKSHQALGGPQDRPLAYPVVGGTIETIGTGLDLRRVRLVWFEGRDRGLR
jgi:hypothetical protein